MDLGGESASSPGGGTSPFVATIDLIDDPKYPGTGPLPIPTVLVEGGEPNPNNPATYPARQALDFFRTALNNLYSQFITLLGTENITTKDGKTVNLIDVYLKYQNISFTATYTKDYPPGFGGQNVELEDGKFRSDIKIQTYQTWSYNPNGSVSLALHEIAHTLPESREFS